MAVIEFWIVFVVVVAVVVMIVMKVVFVFDFIIIFVLKAALEFIFITIYCFLLPLPRFPFSNAEVYLNLASVVLTSRQIS